MEGFEVAWFTGREFVHYEPHRGTVRGKAQLMQVVFAIARKRKSRESMIELCDYLSLKDRKAIISLAIEVLC